MNILFWYSIIGLVWTIFILVSVEILTRLQDINGNAREGLEAFDRVVQELGYPMTVVFIFLSWPLSLLIYTKAVLFKK